MGEYLFFACTPAVIRLEITRCPCFLWPWKRPCALVLRRIHIQIRNPRCERREWMVKGSFHARLRRTCSSDENIVKFSGTPFLSIAHDVQPFWSELWVSLHLVRTEPIDSYPSHLSPFLSPRYVNYVILRIEWWERRTNTFLSRAVDTGLVSIRLLSDRLPWWDCIERNRHTNSWVCHLSCRYKKDVGPGV